MVSSIVLEALKLHYIVLRLVVITRDTYEQFIRFPIATLRRFFFEHTFEDLDY